MTPGDEAYIRRRFAAAEVEPWPFAHLYLPDVLPPDIYRAMDAAQPSERSWQDAVRHKQVARLGAAGAGRFGLVPAGVRLRLKRPPPERISFSFQHRDAAGELALYAQVWRDRFLPYIELIDRLLLDAFGVAGQAAPGQREMSFCAAGWSIKPHWHGDAELTNALIYFPSEQNMRAQGTYLYDVRAPAAAGAGGEFDPRAIRGAHLCEYAPNTLVAWLNTPHAAHGSVAQPGDPPRRYVYMTTRRAEPARLRVV